MGVHRQKEEDKEDQDLIAEYFARGGQVTKIETKPLDYALGISNFTCGKKLTKTERVAKEKKIEVEKND